MARDEAAAVLGPEMPVGWFDVALIKPVLGARTLGEAIEALGILERLRQDEGTTIELFCDNPDFGGPNAGVYVSHDFSEISTHYSGETVLDALRSALTAKIAGKNG